MADSPRSWRRSLLKSLKLTVIPFAPSFLVVLFFPCSASFISSGERAGPGPGRRAPAPCFPVRQPQQLMDFGPPPLDQPGDCWGSVEWRSRCPGLCRRMECHIHCRSPLLHCHPHLGKRDTRVRCVKNCVTKESEKEGKQSSPLSTEMSLPLCAALSQLVISFKAAIWLRITMSGFVISTSTSGFDTWLASPLPMTTDSYLRGVRFNISQHGG